MLIDFFKWYTIVGMVLIGLGIVVMFFRVILIFFI